MSAFEARIKLIDLQAGDNYEVRSIEGGWNNRAMPGVLYRSTDNPEGPYSIICFLAQRVFIEGEKCNAVVVYSEDPRHPVGQFLWLPVLTEVYQKKVDWGKETSPPSYIGDDDG